MISNILLVCTGNTCRSSMAEYYLTKLLAERLPEQKFNVLSAGIAAVPNSRASQNAILVLKEDGLDLSRHLATQLTSDHLNWADIILTMTNSQKKAVLEINPSVQGKVFLLKQYLPQMRETIVLQQQVEEILNGINSKQEEFWAEKGEAISLLQKKREQLLTELRQVDEQLRAWEEQLFQLTEDEQNKLCSLEKRLTDLEIIDPFGQPKEIYQQCAQEIKQSLHGFVDWLQQVLFYVEE